MRKVVITFGLIAGAVVTVLMLGFISVWHETKNFAMGEIVGYVSLVIALSAVFFGIKSYRDNYAGGKISFGKGFLIGLYITLVASAIYIIGWDVYYRTAMPDFMEQYSAYVLEKAKERGASEEALMQQKAELEAMGEMYKNPFVRAAWTFLEIFPVGLLITLISAALLRKREGGAD